MEIKNEQDLERATRELDTKNQERDRKSLGGYIFFNVVLIAVLLLALSSGARQNVYEGSAVLWPSLLVLLLISAVISTYFSMQRYRMRRFNKPLPVELQLGSVILVLMSIWFNFLMISEMIRNPGQMFYWPRLINGGVDFPGIWLFLPLLIGVNLFFVWSFRQNREKLKELQGRSK